MTNHECQTQKASPNRRPFITKDKYPLILTGKPTFFPAFREISRLARVGWVEANAAFEEIVKTIRRILVFPSRSPPNLNLLGMPLRSEQPLWQRRPKRRASTRKPDPRNSPDKNSARWRERSKAAPPSLPQAGGSRLWLEFCASSPKRR